MRLEQQLLEAVQEAKDRLKELDNKIRELNDSAKELIVSNISDYQDETLEQIKNQIGSVQASRRLLKEINDDAIREIGEYQVILVNSNKVDESWKGKRNLK